jgi:DNA (cytosine-5)-methyltransferase 1
VLPLIRGLDLFCGSGGATAGYMRGFLPGELHMTGVDKWFMRRYIGDDFIEADAMEVVMDASFIEQFDFIHASPPCQLFSPTRTLNPGASHRRVDCLTPLLRVIKEHYAHKIWIIENVPEAPMYSRVHQILRLCASSFPGHTGFDSRRLLHRHRHFRLHNLRVPKIKCNHNGFKPLGVYGSINSQVPGGGEIAETLAEAQKLMQIGWMPWRELKEAIPPAFTEYETNPGEGLAGLREAVLTGLVPALETTTSN